jgi:3-oxoacyl-[acyl-carrier-protein] synthase III
MPPDNEATPVAPTLWGLAHALGAPGAVAELPELAGNSDAAATLHHLGLLRYARSAEAPTVLAQQSCERTLARAGLPRQAVSALLLATSSFDRQPDLREGFAALPARLGLERAMPFGLFGSECSNLLTALRLAADLVRAGGHEHVLVATTDVCGPGPRLMGGFVSVFSDGAASCLVSRRRPGPGFVMEAVALASSPVMWDVTARANLMAYLKGSMNGAAEAVRRCLSQAGWAASGVTHFITGNYNRSVLRTYASQLGLPEEKTFLDNVGRLGHAYAADPLVNLTDLEQGGALRPGDRCLLLGSGQTTWGAAAVRFEGEGAPCG